MITTTLSAILKHHPCYDYEKIGRICGRVGVNTPITPMQILNEVGIEDAIWCLRAFSNVDTRKFIYGLQQLGTVRRGENAYSLLMSIVSHSGASNAFPQIKALFIECFDNDKDHLDALTNRVNNDSVHDDIMNAIANYCESHDLDPNGFTYSLTVEIAEE